MTPAGRCPPSHGPDRCSRPRGHPAVWRCHSRFVDELRRARAFRAFVAAPDRARVSEPSCRSFSRRSTRLGPRRCSSSSPEDADARDAAERRRGSCRRASVAFLPGPGVSLASGLAPPPHLVGERARALDVLEAGGLVCASAPALARASTAVARPRAARAPGRRRAGHRRARRGARARRLRAGRARRGARPVRRPRRNRRHLPLDGPRAAPDRVLRRRDRAGARVLAVHAAGPAPRSTRRSSTRRRSGAPISSRSTRRDDEDGSRTRRRRPRAAGRPRARPRLAGRRRAARLGGGGSTPLVARGRGRARPLPARPAAAVRGAAAGDRGARARRGGERARRRSSARATASSSRSRTAARPAAGRLLRKVEATLLEPGDAAAARRRPRFAVAPARRGFVWRELGLVLLPDTQVFRKRPPRADARLGRALAVLRRPARRRLRRPRGPRRRQAARLRDEGGRGRHARLPLPRVPRRRPALRPARADRQGLALRRRRRARAGALEARRQGVADAQGARPRRPCASSPAS